VQALRKEVIRVEQLVLAMLLLLIILREMR